MKLSGLNNVKYRIQLQTLGQLLGVDLHVTISDLAIMHSAHSAEALANEALQLYTSNTFGIDAQLPLYQAAALLAACKCLKLKPDKKKLLDCSGAQKKVFDKTVDAIFEIASKISEKVRSFHA